MNEIISKRQLSETIWLYVVQSKEVSRNARAGQFVVIRPYADSERIPLTLCDFDASRETITL
ncbi:MAG: NAD-binding oxidoreductase, partial [Clostridia bacterium]